MNCDRLTDYHASELVFVWDNQFPPGIHDFNDDDGKISAAFQLYVRARVALACAGFRLPVM